MSKEELNNQNAIIAEAAKAGDSDATTALMASEMSTAVAVTTTAPAYATQLLENLKADFVAVNDGLDLDFVYMGSWLIFNKKGVFIEKDDETVSYGDNIDVLIGQGEKRWSLWGGKDTPEDGQLIVACKERDDAAANLEVWLEANPDARTRYSADDLELRYMAYVIPITCLNTVGELPKIYIMSYAPTTTISYGKYAQAVYNGKYRALGVPAKTGINRVVTRISTEEMKGKSSSESWIGLKFEAIGMFDPADYGLNTEVVKEQPAQEPATQQE